MAQKLVLRLIYDVNFEKSSEVTKQEKTASHQHTTFMPTEAVIPGQRLGHLQDYLPGPGTYVRQDLLYASVVGVKQILSTEGAKVRFVRLNVRNLPSVLNIFLQERIFLAASNDDRFS